MKATYHKGFVLSLTEANRALRSPQRDFEAPDPNALTRPKTFASHQKKFAFSYITARRVLRALVVR